jgi:hypothetical protein
MVEYRPANDEVGLARYEAVKARIERDAAIMAEEDEARRAKG